MGTSTGFSLIVLLFAVSSSFFVLGQNTNTTDPCTAITTSINGSDLLAGCTLCVKTPYDGNKTCEFSETSATKPNFVCTETVGEGSNAVAVNVTQCIDQYATNATTTAPPSPAPPTPTPATTTTAAPTTSTNGTSTPPTTVAPSNTTSTVAPSNTTTTAVPTSKGTTTAVPSSGGDGGFSFATFLGGIVFTLAVSSLAYVVWRFYKARTERNYHTFSY